MFFQPHGAANVKSGLLRHGTGQSVHQEVSGPADAIYSLLDSSVDHKRMSLMQRPEDWGFWV